MLIVSEGIKAPLKYYQISFAWLKFKGSIPRGKRVSCYENQQQCLTKSLVITGVHGEKESELSRTCILHLQGNSCVGCDFNGRNTIFTHASQDKSSA